MQKFSGIKKAAAKTSAATRASASKTAKQIPESILGNQVLNDRICASLPSNYNFEMHKIIWHCTRLEAVKVALQFPEGLLMYSTTISDIISDFTQASTLIMGDVTYGACCIDDYTAIALGCDLLVHFGHSCLVPVDITKIKTIYVFVDISIDLNHFITTVKHNFDPSHHSIALVSTIQFVASLQQAKALIPEYSIIVPQSKPLSGGEILGCTAPKLSDSCNTIIYLGDGRFHLEAIMIANPLIPAFRYDPYTKRITRERYDHDEMKSVRHYAINRAKSAKKWCVILGTLGRQGSVKVLDYIIEELERVGAQVVVLLLSEIFPGKLALIEDVDCFVQVACPRLSIDWGYAFQKPLLTPYECAVVLGKVQEWSVCPDQEGGDYPMDFYAKDSLGPWTPNHHPKIHR